MKPKVFISYAREDKSFASRLSRDLQLSGVQTWVDFQDLVPGQPWEVAITKAISECSYFIAVLSSRSIGKRGYVQKEIRLALAIADEYPEGRIFIIPVRLDECEPSFEGLRRLHRADLFPAYPEGLRQLLRVFTYEAEEKRALIEVDKTRRSAHITTLTDRGFGFISGPGLQDIYFHSKELRNVAFDDLHVGDEVYYSLAVGPKGVIAVEIDVERA